MTKFAMIPLLFLFLFLSHHASSQQQLKATLIDCGATVGSTIDGREWKPDSHFISTGTPKNLTVSVLDTTLSTVRSFPYLDNIGTKFCYVVAAYRGGKHLVRTTYFYHGTIDGPPPVFDQIVDGTFWSVVNTTEDFERGSASYYEGVFVAKGKTMSVCLGVNNYTDSDPFISALEVVIVEKNN